MKQEKAGSRGQSRPKKILSDESLPLWTRLGQPSGGPKQISLLSRTKSINDMATAELVSDAMEIILVLAQRAKRQRDAEALQNLVFASKTINRLLESLESTHKKLFAFASEQSEWPVNLSAKKQTVDAAVARLRRLKVGTKSVPPTWRAGRIDELGNANRCRTDSSFAGMAFRPARSKDYSTSLVTCDANREPMGGTRTNAEDVCGAMEA
jgi:hypothetical protein